MTVADSGGLRSDGPRLLDAGQPDRVALGPARALRARRRRQPADQPRRRHERGRPGLRAVERTSSARAGRPNVTAYDDGPVSAAAVAAECGTTPCDPTQPGAYHLIVFRDDGWAYDDPTNTLALTTVTYGIDSAVLFNAEIEINSHDHTLTTTQPSPPGAFDLQTILTHEAGHFLGPRPRDERHRRDVRLLRAGLEGAHGRRRRGPLRGVPAGGPGAGHPVVPRSAPSRSGARPSQSARRSWRSPGRDGDGERPWPASGSRRTSRRVSTASPGRDGTRGPSSRSASRGSSTGSR